MSLTLRIYQNHTTPCRKQQQGWEEAGREKKLRESQIRFRTTMRQTKHCKHQVKKEHHTSRPQGHVKYHVLLFRPHNESKCVGALAGPKAALRNCREQASSTSSEIFPFPQRSSAGPTTAQVPRFIICHKAASQASTRHCGSVESATAAQVPRLFRIHKESSSSASAFGTVARRALEAAVLV